VEVSIMPQVMTDPTILAQNVPAPLMADFRRGYRVSVDQNGCLKGSSKAAAARIIFEKNSNKSVARAAPRFSA